MPIQLPNGMVQAETGAPRVLIIYGPPKVGKTTLLASLPDSLLTDLEDGSDFVTAQKYKLNNPLQIPSYIEEVKKAKDRIKFVSYDTLDRLETWSEEEATRRYKASVMGKNFNGDSVLELPKGGGYYYLRNVFFSYYIQMCNACKYVIFAGHVRDKSLTIDSKEASSADLDLTGKLRNIVCSYSDAIGHVYRDNSGNLKMSFATKETVQCGSRCPHLKGKILDFHTPPTREDWKQVYTFL